MRVKICRGTARGRIAAPASKSMAHRLLLCAAMCEGESRVRGISSCEDVLATLDCLQALGIEYSKEGNDVKIRGKNPRQYKPSAPLRCRESGSTLRFMLPIAMMSGHTAVFYGAEGLMARPMTVYEELCAAHGLTYINDGESIVVKGPLCGGDYTVAGNVSSQFISGLLFALPSAKSDSTIKITPPIESRSYIELTIDALGSFGIDIHWSDEYTLKIAGNQKLRATDVTVEGDYSGAAFPAALNLFSGEVAIDGLREDTIQGDRVYKKYYDMLKSGVPTIHIGDCPDLGPVLFAVAAAKNGGIFTGTKRLKIKESDRAAAMAEELKKFGTSVSVYEDTVVIYPAEFHAPSEVLFGHNDHRIVMSLSILLTLTGGEIDGAEAVSKSYPEFFDHLSELGIEVTRYEI
ncbi:MAG: 3-phosphoshikimate 1-carboxyvinyltransferase [Clostridia bacterium]|nr:3-phosphoshikimate 1-carboxyvinyltransferase [Clostridia bacterium]